MKNNNKLYFGIHNQYKFNKELNPQIIVYNDGIIELLNTNLSKINLGICITFNNKTYYICEKINNIKFRLIDINYQYPPITKQTEINNIFFPFTIIETAKLCIPKIKENIKNSYIVIYNTNENNPIIYTIENLISDKNMISITSPKNRCALILKRGDKITATNKTHLGFKHGDPIQIIDERDFPGYNLDQIVSSNLMHEAFTIVEFDPSKKKLFQSILNPIENNNKALYRPRKKRLMYNTLEVATNTPNLSKITLTGDKIPILNGTDLSEDNFIDATLLNNERNFDDIKATTIGNKTIGITGDFSTFALAFADIGNLTGNLTLKQITDITETSEVLISENLNLFDFTISNSPPNHIGNFNNGNIININHANSFINLHCEGPGNVYVNKLNIKRILTATNQNRFAISLINNTTGFTGYFNNVLYYGNGVLEPGTFLGIFDDDPTIYINQCISFNATRGMYLFLSNANNTYENLSFYNNTSGIDINSQNGTFNNNSMIGNTTDFLNIGSATGNNNADSDGTGANGNWNSGSGNIINKVAATEFESLNYNDDNFLLPNTSSSLLGAGKTPDISDNTHYINGIFIDTTNVTIGAKGRSNGNNLTFKHW